MSKKQASGYQFEASLEKLENIIEQLEQGDLSLEQSLELFETGISLTKQCQKSLQRAEKRISVLREKNGELFLTPYEGHSSTDTED
ncbi:MAG: exodeoxyribonuclease VII small subunit [Gammaproteobacteria bacterium]|nr:MAG: exodeoxyribonuclease VII small subunit [Gammaproteobacteria bacterium]